MRRALPQLLALLLAGLCLISGCGQRDAEPSPEPPAVSAIPAPPKEEPEDRDQPVLEAGPVDGPLGETELAFFNEVYFNK